MARRPIFVLGLDAADKGLIDDWIADGLLGNFKRLSESALWGDVSNPPGLEAGSCWPTFYFGLRPGETGQYDGGRYFDAGAYEHLPYCPATSFREPIWQKLSDAGKLCGVIDAPYSNPVGEINGIKVVDRGAHVPAGGGNYMNFRTYPESLADEIVERFGEDPAGGHSSDFFNLDTAEAVREFRDIYVQRIENKTDMCLHYWRSRPWDFFMCVFTEAHCVGHRCWHLHDPSHPDHDAAIRAAVGDPLKDIYVALDSAVGRIVGAARDDADMVVYLSHGMEARYSGTRLLDRALVRIENINVSTQSGPVMSVARAVWRRMPEFVRRALWSWRNSVSNDGFQPNRGGRRFFEVIANDRTGGVRINLVGREKNGIVQPGAEYEELCAELIAELKLLRNAETREPAIDEIIRVRDHYDGSKFDSLPDILLNWNRSHPINAIESPKIGTVDSTGLTAIRTGDHRPVGRFFALSPRLKPLRLNRKVASEDFAPTIAKSLAVPIGDTDGHPIREMLQ